MQGQGSQLSHHYHDMWPIQRTTYLEDSGASCGKRSFQFSSFSLRRNYLFNIFGYSSWRHHVSCQTTMRALLEKTGDTILVGQLNCGIPSTFTTIWNLEVQPYYTWSKWRRDGLRWGHTGLAVTNLNDWHPVRWIHRGNNIRTQVM